MNKIALAAILIVIGSGSSRGQDVQSIQNDRCWYGSQTFTAGAVLPQGQGLITCGGDGDWEPTSQGDANCLLEDKLFSNGALIILADKTTKLECQTNGHWQVVQ